MAMAFGAVSCTTATSWRMRPVAAVEQAKPAKEPFTRLHMNDGSLYVLADAARKDGVITGHGRKFDARRSLVRTGEFEVATSSVALIEAASLAVIADAKGGEIAATIIGVVLITGLVVLAIGAAVVAATGSCPTLYIEGEDAPVSELFSHAVVRSLETEDFDALGVVDHDEGPFELELRNEFPETHHIRRLQLWSAEVPEGYDRIFRTRSGRTRAARAVRGPTDCRGLGPRCARRLGDVDGKEAALPAHPNDLSTGSASRLSFEVERTDVEHGLVVTGHRSMMGTWMLYRMLSYLGSEAGAYMAQLERDPPELARVVRFARAMGELEISIQTEQGWQDVGRFAEVGPMASDGWLIPLPRELAPGALEVRLEMAQGLFVLDAVQLVELGPEVQLETADPELSEGVGLDAGSAQASLLDPEGYLVTYGGQSVRLSFPLAAGRRELFVAGTGFYHEWIRPDWLEAEDRETFERYLTDPATAFRELAPDYKAVEAHLEDDFWAATIREPLPGMGGAP